MLHVRKLSWKKEDILFVGNDYASDVKGAMGAGLDTVWYNKKQLPDEKALGAFHITGFEELLKIILDS